MKGFMLSEDAMSDSVLEECVVAGVMLKGYAGDSVMLKGYAVCDIVLEKCVIGYTRLGICVIINMPEESVALKRCTSLNGYNLSWGCAALVDRAA